MQIRESSFGYWSSQPAFLAVAAGAALGIGNSARLPYLMSEYGGVVFLAVYLLCLLIVGLPILVAEWALGRWMRDELGAGFARLAQMAHAGRVWKWLGRVGVLGAVLILSYYSVIAGWSLGFLFRGAGGYLAYREPAELTKIFLHLVRDPERSLAWHTLFMVVVTVIVSHGFRDGIERAARVLLPAVLGLSVLFGAIAWFYGDAFAAIHDILAPDFSKLGWRGAVEAVYLAFFTLGLGLGTMMTLGAYLPANVPLARTALWVILADTLFGFITGGALMSLVLASGLKPTSGLTLLFQTFPQSLPDSLPGVILAVLYYGILFIVTLLAATSLLEPVTRFLMERYRQTRVFAAVGAALACWVAGLGSLLSFSIADDVKLFGSNFFEWMQFVTSFVIVPVSGLLVCIFISRILQPELSLAVWGPREQVLHRAWRFALRYPARIGLVIVLLHGLGVLDWIARFWGEAA
ncbi:MAG TPA: sodium-dependent transporter [Nevskiaceae bacterium]|nr:sodium-dependent transporter [Nevskiaceae bacterium]